MLWNMCFLLPLYRVNYRTGDMQYKVRSSLSDSLHEAAVSSIAAVCPVLAPIPLLYLSHGVGVVLVVVA